MHRKTLSRGIAGILVFAFVTAIGLSSLAFEAE